MARPRTRTRKQPAPELEAVMDTISDEINPDAEEQPARKSRPSRQKPGAKKVMGETSRLFGDALAMGVKAVTQGNDTRKGMDTAEAESIAHPLVRMIGRRLPNWLKPLLPRTKLNQEDTADIEEMLATLAKYGLRLLTITFQDLVTAKERAQAYRETHTVHSTATVAPDEYDDEEDSKPVQPATQPASNGHSMFSALSTIDLGIEVL